MFELGFKEFGDDLSYFFIQCEFWLDNFLRFGNYFFDFLRENFFLDAFS